MSEAAGWTEADLARLPVKDGVRQRGLETTRIETFTDAAFAFAMTMLVVSAERIPRDYAQLVLALEGTPAFAASFATIMMFWSGHRTWTRHYGLENRSTNLITMLLIFVALIYVYPLRLMFSSLFSWLTGGWLHSEFAIQQASELTGLFVIYGAGFAALGGSMSLLYLASLRARRQLRLNPLEEQRTRAHAITWGVQSLSGVLSALFAALLPQRVAVYAGFVYISLPIVMPILAIRFEKRAAELST